MDIHFYEKCKHRFVTFLYAMLWSLLITKSVQWALGVCDITPKNIWFQGSFLVLTFLIWAPWQAVKLPPKNDGNNDLFPGV